MSKPSFLLQVAVIPLGIVFRLSVVLGLTAVVLLKLLARRTQRAIRKPQRRRSRE